MNDNLIDELLPIYYKRLFPASLLCKWLSYGNYNPSIELLVIMVIVNFHFDSNLIYIFQLKGQRNYFPRREFSFTLKDDVYLRYQTFNDFNEFEKELLKKIPYKIDIGSVYNNIVNY